MKLTTLIIQNADLLRRLSRDPAPATQAALASELGRDGSNLSKSISHLAKEKLVDRDMSKRSPVPTLTDLGREAVAALDRAEGGETADALPDGWTLLHSGQIEFDPNNARSRIDAEGLEALAYSIAERGLQQNLVVRPPLEPNGHWRLIAGERRLRAIRMVQERGEWPKGRRILCKIEQGEDLDADVAALHENLQREDLHPLDEAAAYKRLADVHGLGTAEIAARVKRSQRHVQDRLRFTDLREDLKHRMRLPEDHEHHLTPTAVRQLLNAQRPKPPAPETARPDPEQDDIPSFLRRLASGDAAPPPAAAETPPPAPSSVPQAAPPPVHRFSVGGGIHDPRRQMEQRAAEQRELEELELTPHERLGLVELAHKLQSAPVAGYSEPHALTHQYWLDGVYSSLAKHGLVRIIPTGQGQLAVLSLKGGKKLAMERPGKPPAVSELELHALRREVGKADWPANGGYVTTFLQDPPSSAQPDAVAEEVVPPIDATDPRYRAFCAGWHGYQSYRGGAANYAGRDAEYRRWLGEQAIVPLDDDQAEAAEAADANDGNTKDLQAAASAVREALKAAADEVGPYDQSSNWHARRRAALDRRIAELNPTLPIRINERWDGARVRICGLSSSSTSGLEGALRNWAEAAEARQQRQAAASEVSA